MIELIHHHYNPIIAIISALFLGIAAGLTGMFLVLRKEALLSDAITHSTLPGIGLGFLISLTLGLDDGKNLPILLICAFITSFSGVLFVNFAIRHTRLKPDTVITAVMSCTYGLGLLLFSYIQTLSYGNKAGLTSFLLGQVAAVTFADMTLIVIISSLASLFIILCFKELCLLTFDPLFAKLTFQQEKIINLLLSIVITLIICVGLKTVGVVLILALMTIPAISAMQIAKRCQSMAAISAILGATSCVTGILITLYNKNLPAGATIVLCAFSLFVICLLVRKLWGRCV